MVLGGLLACGRGGPSTSEPVAPPRPALPPLTVELAVAHDADLAALVAARSDTAWRVGGKPEPLDEVVVVDVELLCMNCSPTCEPKKLGAFAAVDGAWKRLGAGPVDQAAVLAAQPVTGEVSLRRTVAVAGAEAVGWPTGFALTARDAAGAEVAHRRSGDRVLLVAEGEVVLEGGGPAPAGAVVSSDEVVLPARALGLDVPAGGVAVQVKTLPTMAMAAPLPTVWQGPEVVVAYHRAQTVSGEGARLQGLAAPAALTARLQAIDAARWPGLEGSPWLHYTWAGAGPLATDRGLVLPRGGGGEAEGWALRALPADATPRLRAAVAAWARGEAGEPACFGVLAMPVAPSGPAGAAVLVRLEAAVGAEALRAALLGASSWPALLDALPAEAADAVRADLGLGPA